MFVQIENTPNPNALKFIPGSIPISKDKPYDFPNIESTNGVSDLAKKLFEIEDVLRVFFGSNYITITKREDIEWHIVKPHIFATIVEYLTNGWPIFCDEDVSVSYNNDPKEENINPRLKEILNSKPDMESQVVKEIIALIDERIRPAVHADGGDINFVNFIDGTVYVEMLGACSGCPSSGATLQDGIANMLKHFIPEVKEVEAV